MSSKNRGLRRKIQGTEPKTSLGINDLVYTCVQQFPHLLTWLFVVLQIENTKDLKTI